MTLLQWNQRGAAKMSPTVRVQRTQLFAEMLREISPTFVLLQEPLPDSEATLQSGGFTTFRSTSSHYITGIRTTAWINPRGGFQHEHRHFGLVLADPLQNSTSRLAIWNVHLPSRMRRQDPGIAKVMINDLYYELRQRRVSDVDYAGRHEILSGDFNLSPYESVFWTIQANRTLSMVTRRKASAPPDQVPLYNPSWGLLYERGGPGGTYYYMSEHDLPWYVYDQTIISPELASASPSQLVKRVGATSLFMGQDQYPNPKVGSDHYPVLVPLNI